MPQHDLEVGLLERRGNSGFINDQKSSLRMLAAGSSVRNAAPIASDARTCRGAPLRERLLRDADDLAVHPSSERGELADDEIDRDVGRPVTETSTG